MEDMVASFWIHEESIDELKQKLLYTTLELETLREEAAEEMRNNKESVKQLFHYLKIACQERDEAKDQLQKLLNKINCVMPTTPNDQMFATPNISSHFLAESPLLKPTRANSSITESNSFSDAYNHSSSPVDSLFDPVSSPEFSNINIHNNSNIAYVNNLQCDILPNSLAPAPQKIDHASLVIENMVKGKTLPKKGKLLQAVLEAGPLLQTLLVAGPLPRWRNPPPLQAFHVPAVSIKGCDVADQVVAQKLAAGDSSFTFRASPNLQSYAEMSCGMNSMTTNSALSVGDGGSWRMISAGSTANYCVPNSKRQRFQ